jgi:hypothetical protein
MSKNSCIKCGAKKHTKIGNPISRGVDSVQRVRCDKCSQMRMNVIKPRKKKEASDAIDSNNFTTDN